MKSWIVARYSQLLRFILRPLGLVTQAYLQTELSKIRQNQVGVARYMSQGLEGLEEDMKTMEERVYRVEGTVSPFVKLGPPPSPQLSWVKEKGDLWEKINQETPRLVDMIREARAKAKEYARLQTSTCEVADEL